MYVCTWHCVDFLTCMHACIHPSTHPSILSSIHTDRHTDRHRRTDRHTDTHTDTYTQIYLCMYIYIYIHELCIFQFFLHWSCSSLRWRGSHALRSIYTKEAWTAKFPRTQRTRQVRRLSSLKLDRCQDLHIEFQHLANLSSLNL